MLAAQFLEGAFERVPLQLFRNFEKERLVVVMRFFQVLLEKPVLNGRERHVTGNSFAGTGGGFGSFGHRSQFRNGLVCEQEFRRELQPFAPRCGDDLNAENGVATEFKEIVVDSYFFNSQHLRPHRRQLLFILRSRSNVGAGYFRSLLLGNRKHLSIDFSVVGERKLFEEDKRRGNHVVRQLWLQVLAQLVHVGARKKP